MFFFEQLSLQEKKILIKKLETYYDSNLDNLNENMFYINKSTNKIYISNIDFNKLNLNLQRINAVGLYFGTYHDKNRFRLSIEGSQLIISNQNYIILDDKSIKSYISGENLFKEEVFEINHDQKCPFLIVKYKKDNIGCVSIKDNLILSYVPKSRRLNFDRLF